MAVFNAQDPHNKAHPEFERTISPTTKREVQEVTDEVMAHESPEGRPPSPEVRARGLVLFFIVLGTLLIALFTVLIVNGGPSMAAFAIVMLIALCGAAFPVWRAGMLRHKEEVQIEGEVRQQMDTRRWGWWKK